MLPTDTTYKLDTRYGSEKDKNNLKETFENFGFKVIIEEDLIHLDMIKKITDVLTDIKDESSLFICILSHGDEGNNNTKYTFHMKQYVCEDTIIFFFCRHDFDTC